MIIRAFFSFFILVFFVVTPVAAKDSCPKDPNYVSVSTTLPKALLYRVEHCSYPTSYLFGTFHSDSPKLAPIFKLAVQAMKKVSALDIEVVLNADIRREAQVTMVYPPSHPGLHAVISSELFERTFHHIGSVLGMSMNQMDRYKPWALAVLVQYPKHEGNGVVLDEKLQHKALALGIPVQGLETIGAQLNIFDSLPEKDQISLLDISLDQIAEITSMHQEITEYYLSQNLQAIQDMSDRMFDDMAKNAPRLARHLEKRVLNDRNLSMLKSLLPHLEDKPTMVAVGALHLSGKNGLLQGLEKKGFHLYPVTLADAQTMDAAPEAALSTESEASDAESTPNASPAAEAPIDQE